MGTKEAAERIKKLEKRKSLLVDKKLEGKVKKIIEDVRKGGDRALLKYTRKFDGAALTPQQLKVTKKEMQKAQKSLDKDFMKALKDAYWNIRRYHEEQLPQSFRIIPRKGVHLEERFHPLYRIGIYVPGGKASYPSTVLMAGVGAQLTGVKEIVMVSPPGKDGSLSPYILAAADLVEVNTIYKMGGAQAIAALAYGTESVAPVDKIFGPGNIYVTLAKKLVYGEVAIDMLAGPSEIVIAADSSARADWVAADMLAQAEHGTGAEAAICLTTDEAFAQSLQAELDHLLSDPDKGEELKSILNNYSGIFICSDREELVDLINRLAPEHLELYLQDPRTLLPQIHNAAAIFIGPYSPESIGDYMAGPNHILPTSGTARFASPLGARDFCRSSHIISYSEDAFNSEADAVIKLARSEGLDAHARAVAVRKKRREVE
jgi:histidinol dehydrogenase